jgi:hypothetical protein
MKPSSEVQGRLPQRARELLSQAAIKRRDVRQKAVNDAIKVVKAMYPEYFKPEKE